ncbi:MAG: UDP-glucose--hexose-1-phosphate uridylyltransferase [Eubacterium sp.]|nr:UDP-glucose--hexose-1-phosphate uridylyltransferase [Eubacterium sp.]
MKDINYLINELIIYGLSNNLISKDDEIYSRNKLIEFFRIDSFEAPAPADMEAINSSPRELHLILTDMLEYAAQEHLMESDTITYKDLFDTAIMGLITPPPSAIRKEFRERYDNSPKAATDFYYSFSKATNYIRTDRIAKDEKWVTPTEYGNLDITINLSKPEKDPRDIAAAGKAKKSGYPACLLCMENEGFNGSFIHPARQNHRIIPIVLDDENYFLQYSPYVYYNEHCIVFNEKHIPMKIDKSTMRKLLSFVQQFPHYTVGSNADLPIVGGSILSHDHFQGGGYVFPMVNAPYEEEFSIKGFEDVHAGIIKWPLSTIRLQGRDMDRTSDLADHILSKWRSYSDKDAFIFADTKGTPHNTITPIARLRTQSSGETVFELDLVLRNNITTEEHPLGVFHPHAEYHHIKKENIGLIEVMGLAVLPSRLKAEISELVNVIQNGTDLCKNEMTKSHAKWILDILPKYGYTVAGDGVTRAVVTGTPENAGISLHNILQKEIGFVFLGVLEDAGVYKCTKEGRASFMRFISEL